ncbi:MAG: alpha,2-mannosidase, partial [Akkermansiaceae bacterium]|nr:alpha,2-mannosidase [Akkermansiaceae bacterium]
DFYQGTPWNYSFNVHHARDEMIAKMGGRARFLQRMEFAYGKNSAAYIDFTNEPCFQTIWLFSHASRPYLASYWADQLRQKYGDYSFTGDEDSGAMSSLYFFLTAGFFPVGGQDTYYLHGSRVPRLEFNLANGKTFTVTAANSGGRNLYVQSATLNGVALDVPVIHHADIQGGGTLAFVMGPAPSAWGTGGDFATPATSELVMPVSGPWSSPATAATEITGGATASPGWQNGAAVSALDAAFSPVTLSETGDTVTLSAKVSFDGTMAEAMPSASRFAWGLFSSNAQPGVSGWTGYLAANDTAADGSQNLWKKPAGNATPFYTTSDVASAQAAYRLAPVDFTAGEYRLILTLTRNANAGIDYRAALVRSSDGVLVSAFTGADLSPAGFTFDRAGFRAGADLGSGTIAVKDCTVTAGRSTYAGRELVIPEGAAFYWDGGELALGSVVNQGALVLSGGSVAVAGDLTNPGVVYVKGPADLSVGGTLVNQGTLDKISSTGRVSATISGDGVVLEPGSVKQSLSVSGLVLTFSLYALKGHVYQLQKDASGVLTGPWEDVGDAIAGTGEMVTKIASVEVGRLSGFYRFEVDP